MKLQLPTFAPPTFNVLCLGERGTGKTVFLIASYAEFQKSIATINKKKKQKKDDNARQFYFECQGMGESLLLDNILRYVLSEGNYPPPTLAVTDFNFAITEQKASHYDLLGFLRWWDMPGEYCNFSNSYYQKMAMDSHAICLF
ncbi:MAG: hypothetical protein ACRC6M_00990, partial [Microcystaceae cyanobacterium]